MVAVCRAPLQCTNCFGLIEVHLPWMARLISGRWRSSSSSSTGSTTGSTTTTGSAGTQSAQSPASRLNSMGVPIPASKNTMAGPASWSALNSSGSSSSGTTAGPSPGVVPVAVDAPTGPMTWLAAQNVAISAVPSMPKLLGFAGVLPFLGLTPYLVEAAGLHQWVVDAARMQLNYGALIVTFLGAVHWGLAMTSTLTGPRAAVMLRERYLWSVGPALLAWPVLSMETAPGSLMIALLLVSGGLADDNVMHRHNQWVDITIAVGIENSIDVKTAIILNIKSDVGFANTIAHGSAAHATAHEFALDALVANDSPAWWTELFSRRLHGMCFLSDRADAKLGLLPSWYLPLRGWLTTLSMLSMLATTTYFVAK
ncbi:hypothetical protein QJQ45_013886, partial [Haematococcus lacustris]